MDPRPTIPSRKKTPSRTSSLPNKQVITHNPPTRSPCRLSETRASPPSTCLSTHLLLHHPPISTPPAIVEKARRQFDPQLHKGVRNPTIHNSHNPITHRSIPLTHHISLTPSPSPTPTHSLSPHKPVKHPPSLSPPFAPHLHTIKATPPRRPQPLPHLSTSQGRALISSSWRLEKKTLDFFGLVFQSGYSRTGGGGVDSLKMVTGTGVDV